MKKSVIATIAAAAVAALCIPAFSGCSAQVGYILKTDDNGEFYYSVAAQGFTSFMKGEVVIPEAYGQGDSRFPVKEIEEQAFAGTSITKVTIPATIEKIGTAAFSYNSKLAEVVFAEGSVIEEISWGSFAYCRNLKSFTMPSSVKTVDGLAFYGCDNLTEINFSAGLERINGEAFGECKKLASVNLPEGLISIGVAAFYNCVSLEQIIVPGSLRDTERPSLDGAGNQITDEDGTLVTIKIPALGEIAFFGCDSLKIAVLGEGITAVPEGLFGSCVSLETVYLPSTLTAVKGVYSTGSVTFGHAFYNTASLQTVYFAGTEEQWEAVEIDNTPYGGVSDNSALINATVICNTNYNQ